MPPFGSSETSLEPVRLTAKKLTEGGCDAAGQSSDEEAFSEQDFSGPTNTEPAFCRIPGLRHYQ